MPATQMLMTTEQHSDASTPTPVGSTAQDANLSTASVMRPPPPTSGKLLKSKSFLSLPTTRDPHHRGWHYSGKPAGSTRLARGVESVERCEGPGCPC